MRKGRRLRHPPDAVVVVALRRRRPRPTRRFSRRRTVSGRRASRSSLAYAELDGGVGDDLQMPAASRAVHDELCHLEGPKAKDGVGHCPTMFMAKGESHMSEVFSIGSSDKTVSNAVLAFINSHK